MSSIILNDRTRNFKRCRHVLLQFQANAHRSKFFDDWLFHFSKSSLGLPQGPPLKEDFARDDRKAADFAEAAVHAHCFPGSFSSFVRCSRFLWFILWFWSFHLSFCPVLSLVVHSAMFLVVAALNLNFPAKICHVVSLQFFHLPVIYVHWNCFFTKKWLIIHNSPQICDDRYLINQSLTWLIAHLFDMTYTQQNDWFRIFLTWRIRNKMLRTISPVGALSRCKRILDIDCLFVKFIDKIESVVGQISGPRISCRRFLQSDTEQFHIIRTNVTQITFQISMLLWCSN